MVVKTELCAFSEYRIYPGHGIKFIKRDGQPVILSNSKCKSLFHQKKKSSKLMWTQAWRRMNKKGKDENLGGKKKARRTMKVMRAIVGATVEELKSKRQATKPKNVATEAALKEVKAAKKAAAKSAGPRTGAQVNIPKVQRSSQNARGGAQR